MMNLSLLLERTTKEDNHFGLALVGLCSGLLTSLIIIGFQLGFSLPTTFLLPNHTPEGFESLSPFMRFALPLGGAILLGAVFHLFKLQKARTGLAHTVYTTNKRHALFPKNSFLAQFFGGIIALSTGQSVGQEGPAVHLGAAGCAIAGQYAGAPVNLLRTLAGCGTAAAIATVFNAPLAGVVFAMEVVLLEYTITGFIPVITAAVCATFIRGLATDDSYLTFTNTANTLQDLEFLLLAVMSLLIALTSSAFVIISRFWLKFENKPLLLRFTLAGLITGLLAVFSPEIMGTGHDTLLQLLNARYISSAIILILFAKILASGTAIGLGIPGGIIGPSLLMGACIGALFAGFAETLSITTENHHAEYVLLGMAAMMSAAINAPLAAIIFIVELSYNSQLLFPGLLLVIVSNLLHSSLFKQASMVKLIFDFQGVSIANHAFDQTLSRRSLMQTMCTNIIKSQTDDDLPCTRDTYEYIVRVANGKIIVAPANDSEPVWHASDSIATTASLLQAWQMMQTQALAYLVCVRKTKKGTLYIGVLTQEKIKEEMFR